MDPSDHLDGHARDGLILQLIGWAAERPRTYGEAMEAWRSSCPALTIWEDALAEGLIAVEPLPGGRSAAGRVRVTRSGHARLRSGG